MTKLRCNAKDTVAIMRGPNAGKLGHIEAPAAEHCWRIRSLGAPFVALDGGVLQGTDTLLCDDKDLAPLRDDPGKDQMLRLTGKPKRMQNRSSPGAAGGPVPV